MPTRRQFVPSLPAFAVACLLAIGSVRAADPPPFTAAQLDQMAKNYMEIDARTAYTYEAITVTEACNKKIVDAGIQYLAAYKDDAGRWLDGASSRPINHPTR